jgi:hypothetical protein
VQKKGSMKRPDILRTLPPAWCCWCMKLNAGGGRCAWKSKEAESTQALVCHIKALGVYTVRSLV